jgi:uncharacterized protein HemY
VTALRNALALVLVVVFGLFVTLNWTALTTVQPIDLGLTSYQAPLGLLMLVIIALLTLVYLVYGLGLRTSHLVESRRSSRELEAARKLADEAEQSRVADLRTLVETEFGQVHEEVAREAAATRERLDESGRTLQAYLGEIDDFLKRQGPTDDQDAPQGE